MFLLALFRILFAFAVLNVVALFQRIFPRPLARLRVRAALGLFQYGMGADDVAIGHLRAWGDSASRAFVALRLDARANLGLRTCGFILLRLAFPEIFMEHCDEIIDSMPDEQSRVALQSLARGIR
jgi:hypothetical protein